MPGIQIARYGTSQDFFFGSLHESKLPMIINANLLKPLIGGKTLAHDFFAIEMLGKVRGLRLPFTDQSSIVVMTDWGTGDLNDNAMLDYTRVAYLPRP